MNVALIFAGGTGQRMNSRSKPKQFLEMYGKPIIIYTLEHFEKHPNIDYICIVCLKGWEKELNKLIDKFGIGKVRWITCGGETGHESIYNGLQVMKNDLKQEDVVVIHDGVRPLINEELITTNLNAVEVFGNSITVEKVSESVVQRKNDGSVTNVPPRSEMGIAKAPQCFRYGEICKVHELAKRDHFKAIDSAHLLYHYGYKLHTVESTQYNIKIATPSDFYVFRAIFEARENSQIFGI